MTKRGYMYQALMLTTLATYVLNTVKEGVQLTKSKAENAEALQRRQIMEQRVSNTAAFAAHRSCVVICRDALS